MTRGRRAKRMVLFLVGLMIGGCGQVQSALPPTQPTLISSASVTSEKPLKAGDLLFIRDGYGSNTDRLSLVDTTGGKRAQEMLLGVPSPDWSTLYTAQQHFEIGKRATYVRALNVTTGQPIRQITLNDVFELPAVELDGGPGGLSPDGRWLVLQTSPYRRDGKWQSRFIVLDTAFKQTPRTVNLSGNYLFDAISNDGNGLFLIENIPPEDPTQYKVRLYDLTKGGMDPQVVADKTDTEIMSGLRRTAIPSRDGEWLFSLYVRDSSGPFIHALNLKQRFAVCIDLPEQGKEDFEKQLLWSLAMGPDGKTLYAANGALGLVAEVSVDEFKVMRTATIPTPSTSVISRLSALLDAPVAEAKRILIGGAALSSNGATLFVLADKGLLAINTKDLTLRGRYLTDTTLDSVAVSPDGERLYVVSVERNQIMQISATNGAMLGEVSGVKKPWGVLHVVAFS